MITFDSLPTSRVVAVSLCSLFRRVSVSTVVFVLGCGILQAQDKTRLAGMTQEIEVKSAKDLSVKAPSGEKVAVLDQSGANADGSGNKVQDHHNGWLTLSAAKVEGNLIKVKGKYYVPSSAAAVPKEIRFTVRKQQPDGLAVFVDKSLPLDRAVDQWLDFEIDLPLKDDLVLKRPDAKFVLMLSAVPFAGPVYLDNLEVTDSQNNPLWDFPEFE